MSHSANAQFEMKPQSDNSFGSVYCNKRVLITGHTGFKGSWLAEWLLALGAEVTGFSLAVANQPSLFDELGLSRRLRHQVGDIRDLAAMKRMVAEFKPDYVFHLAAQSLVRPSYAEPVETFATNILGTVHILEAIRLAEIPCSIVAVTSDKCYENREWLHSYRETDPLGGHDPYSCSKAAAELVIDSYRRAYFSQPIGTVHLASARAGNVLGGGDWAQDRIVPDSVRSLTRGEPIPVRNRRSRRPWQHVLEPLSGYLRLGACLNNRRAASAAELPESFRSSEVAAAFNFGPAIASNRTVAELVQEFLKHWHGSWEDRSSPAAAHEAQSLNLASEKAYRLLGWRPVWSFERTIELTAQWYLETKNSPTIAREITNRQINEYLVDARQQGITWVG